VERRTPLRITVYAARIVAGIFIVALFLMAAGRTTRDCTIGLYVYDICAWVWVREQLGLPASKFLRAALLEIIGLTLTVGIFLTVRFVFPFWRTAKNPKPQAKNAQSGQD